MNIESFLQSGLLESYALGQCTEQDKTLVEEMLAAHAEARKELSEIESALETYASAYAVQPPEWMKGKILDGIRKDVPFKPAPPATGGGSSAIMKILPWAFAAASLVLGFLYMQGEQAKTALQTQLASNDAAIKDCLTREATLQQTERQMAFLLNPGTQKTVVNWLDPATAVQSTIIAYNNANLKQMFLQANGLPALAANEDYQFWVITADSPAPKPLKVFANTAGGLIDMQYYEGAQAFAVSVEPKGGSPNGAPTKVIMLGSV